MDAGAFCDRYGTEKNEVLIVANLDVGIGFCSYGGGFWNIDN